MSGRLDAQHDRPAATLKGLEARRVSLIANAVQKGAEVRTGGKPIGNKGNFFEPTVLTGATPEMRVMSEPFGGVKDSGYGSEGGREAIEGYLNIKFVTQAGFG